MHKWYQSTACPGPYLGGKFPYIVEEVNKRLGGKVEPPKETEPIGGCTVNLPVLKKGSKGESVKALQTLLIGNGYSCGSYGADGSFGDATDQAVRAYQKDNGLTVDGIVGTNTWNKLLGVIT